MKKIYYLKQEVKIGDIIDINGFKVQITQRVIDENPDKFVLKDNNQELLEQAKIKYPIGTKFYSANNRNKDILTAKHTPIWHNGLWIGTKDNGANGVVYIEGQWAEIIPNEKTLEDYENELFIHNGYRTVNGHSIDNKYFYEHLKAREPKLYWLKVLQLIADDLNDGWEPDWGSGDFKYDICMGYGSKISSTLSQSINDGNVYFKSRDIADKAIELMGDNLKYIYGNV